MEGGKTDWWTPDCFKGSWGSIERQSRGCVEASCGHIHGEGPEIITKKAKSKHVLHHFNSIRSRCEMKEIPNIRPMAKNPLSSQVRAITRPLS